MDSMTEMKMTSHLAEGEGEARLSICPVLEEQRKRDWEAATPSARRDTLSPSARSSSDGTLPPLAPPKGGWQDRKAGQLRTDPWACAVPCLHLQLTDATKSPKTKERT